MGKPQVFRGILQYNTHEALVHAMDIVLAEAPAGEGIGLQDCYIAPGIMLFNLNTVAPESLWGETLEAFGILAENASRGYVFATFEDQVEYYEAGQDHFMPRPKAHKLQQAEDYFPFREGSRSVLRGNFGEGDFEASWNVRRLDVKGVDAYYLADPSMRQPGYNEYLDGTYFWKDGEYVYALYAPNEAALMALDMKDDNYARQLAYNSRATIGDVTACIWNDSESFQIHMVEDFVSLETPAGKLDRVMQIRVDNYHVNAESFHKTSFRQFFARGYGLVRVEAGKGSLMLHSYQD